MSEKFPDPEENRRPDKADGENEDAGIATVEEVIGAIGMLLENHQEGEIRALYAKWAKTQEQKRDALSEKGDRAAVEKFMVESALDRAQIYAARKNISDAYMLCVEAEYIARQSDISELLPECQEKQNWYYDTSDLGTRIECDRARARFLAQNTASGIKAAFNLLSAAVATLREENRPDLKPKIIETALQILRYEWRRLCWYVESGRGAEVVLELTQLAMLARFAGQEDMGQAFQDDAGRAERGGPLRANLDWPPEEDE